VRFSAVSLSKRKLLSFFVLCSRYPGFRLLSSVYCRPPLEFTETVNRVYVAPPHATLDGSGDLDERQLWRAKILHIRVPDRDHPTLVWMVIDWYWAPTEFTQLKKSFNPRLCGYNEIIYVSNKTDVVSCASLNGHANVHAYDDADHLRLGQISESEYYCRTEYDNTHKRFKRETIPSCVCRKKYVPDDERTMVLCPRSTCLNWYHTACLERHDMRYYPSEASELEALWASTQDDGSLETFAKELEQCWAVSELNDSKRSDTDEDLHALQQIAHRPCMRGGPYGIVGNAGVVLRARYLLELVLKDEVEMWSNWRDFVWGEGGAWRMPRFEHMRHHSEEGEGQVVSYACPSCSRPI